jgi:hypothetical protein
MERVVGRGSVRGPENMRFEVIGGGSSAAERDEIFYGRGQQLGMDSA